MTDVLDRLNLPDFHPVIFANGEDDDLPGIEAAFLNQPVYYLNTLVAPGEAIIIGFKNVALSKYMSIEDANGTPLLIIGDGFGAPHIVRLAGDGPERSVVMHHCTIHRAKPEG